MFENNKYFMFSQLTEIVEPGIKHLMMLKYKLNKRLIENEKKNLNLIKGLMSELLIQFSSGI